MLKALIIALGFLIAPGFSQGAVNCAPDGKTASDLDPIELSNATLALQQRVFASTTAEGDWVTCTRDLSLQARKLALKLQADAPTIDKELGNAYVTLIMTSEALLLSLRVRAEIPKLPDLVLSFKTQDYLRLFPLMILNIEGTTGQVSGQRTRLFLNGESQFSAHLAAIAKTRKLDQARQYYETSRCLLARTFIEKAEGHAILNNRISGLNLAGATACDGLELNKLIDQNISFIHEGRTSQLIKNLKKSENFLSSGEIAQISSIAKEEKVDTSALIVKSAISKDSNPKLKIVDNFFSRAEDDFAKTDEIARDLVEIGVGLRPYRDQILSDNRIQVELTKFDDIYTRIILGDVVGEIALSSALALTTRDVDLIPNLVETLTYTISQAIEFSTKTEIVIDGHLPAPKANEFSLLQNNRFIATIRQLVLSHKTAEKIAARMANPVRTPLLELEKYKALFTYAIELQKITDPKVKFQDLPYDPMAVARLFDGNIETLPPEFKFYALQMINRNKHEDRVKVWERLKPILAADEAKYKYRCDAPNFGQKSSIMFRAVFRLPTEPNVERSQNCYFVKNLADYLGIGRSDEPKKIADIFWALQKHNDEDTIERFDKLYREILKNHGADKNRILDIPLRKIGIRSDKFLYDVIVENIDQTTLPPEKPATDNKPIEIQEDKADYVNGLVDKALQLIQHENEVSALNIVKSKNLDDIEPYILETGLLDELLGASGVIAYKPGLANLRDKQIMQAFPSVYQYHTSYKDTLLRRKGLNKALNDKIFSTATLPYVYLGAAWLLRGTAIRTPGIRWIGTKLFTQANSLKIVTQGYSTFMNWIFAGGAVTNYFWHTDIRESLEVIESLKYGDALINPEDVALIDYSHYVFRKTGLEIDKSKARNQILYDGAFALLSPIINLVEPAATAGLVEFKRFNKMNSWISSIVDQARGARLDKIRLGPMLKRLGLTGEDLSVVKLRTGRSQMLSQTGANEVVIEEAYKRVVFTLGRRAQQVIGNKEKAKAVAKELYGSENMVDELTRISSEYNRLFPDLVRGGL